MRTYAINLTAKEIGIIQSALRHIEGIVWTESIRGNIDNQFAKHMRE